MRSIAPGAAADMAFVAGRRDVGLWLITQIVTAEPLSYSQLLAEHAKEFMDNVNGNDSSDDN